MLASAGAAEGLRPRWARPEPRRPRHVEVVLGQFESNPPRAFLLGGNQHGAGATERIKDATFQLADPHQLESQLGRLAGQMVLVGLEHLVTDDAWHDWRATFSGMPPPCYARLRNPSDWGRTRNCGRTPRQNPSRPQDHAAHRELVRAALAVSSILPIAIKVGVNADE